MNFEVVSEEYVSNSEVKKLLADRKEAEFELGKAKEHVKDFSKISVDKAQKLAKELAGLGMGKLKSELIINIVNILPADVEELKLILSMGVMPFSEEEMQKIFELVKPYL